jgi:hypothetical protein
MGLVELGRDDRHHRGCRAFPSTERTGHESPHREGSWSEPYARGNEAFRAMAWGTVRAHSLANRPPQGKAGAGPS